MLRLTPRLPACLRLTVLATALPLSSLPAQAPATTKVEVQIVGPYDPSTSATQYTVSAQGAHIGTVVPKGSRVAVSVDGVEGPRFDDILLVPGGRGERVALSSDGARYAYVGKLGQELVAIIDGKEAFRAPAATTEFVQLPQLQPNPGFTAGGKHSYFLVQTTDPAVTNNTYTMYLDGVAGPRSGEIFWPWFSPEGGHVAYIVANPANRQQHALIFDGKPAGYPPPGVQLEGEPTFTGDGMHMFTYGILPRGAGIQVMVDGRPYLKAPGPHVYTAPTGNLFVTRVSAGNPPVEFLDIAGRRVPGSDGSQIDTVFFSRDGKHWAARIHTAANTAFILADGKKGLDYQNIGNVGFTADGRPVYTADNAGKRFVVVGEEESDAFQNLLPVSSSATGLVMTAIGGNRVGFLAMAGQNQVAVVDFKAIPRRAASDLGFSPDGSRVAFAYFDGLNIDGVDQATGAATAFYRVPRAGSLEPPGKFLFSPDSRHLVHFGVPAGGNAFGIFMDGKFLAVGNRLPYNPTFTPDSRHLFWMDTTPGEAKYGVYLDGNVALKFDFNTQSIQHPGWWDMGQDGVLTIAVTDGGSLKRIRITPGSDSSVETMLAKMGKPR